MPYSTYEHKIDSNIEAIVHLVIILSPIILLIIAYLYGD